MFERIHHRLTILLLSASLAVNGFVPYGVLRSPLRFNAKIIFSEEALAAEQANFLHGLGMAAKKFTFQRASWEIKARFFRAAFPKRKIRAHRNETPYDDWRLRMTLKLRGLLWPLNRYDSEDSPDLKSELSDQAGVPRSQILVTAAGSSDLIPVLVDHIFSDTQGLLLLPEPNFGYWGARLSRDPRTVVLPLNRVENFDLDPERLAAMLAKENYSFVLITNPNNPTGSFRPPSDYKELIERYPETLFVFDEAYADFVDETALPLQSTNPNVVITRSFSKGYGLAGERVGYMLAAENIIDSLETFATAHELTREQEEAAVKALRRTRFRQKVVRQSKQWRSELAERLSHLPGFVVLPSVTNFFLADLTAWGPGIAAELVVFLAAQNIKISDYSGTPGLLGEYPRITAQKPWENHVIASAVEEFFGQNAGHFRASTTCGSA